MARRDRSVFLYYNPVEPKNEFGQCSACILYTGAVCSILGPNVDVDDDDSCGAYVPGPPRPHVQPLALLKPRDVGLVSTKVRCINCTSFDDDRGKCMLFERLSSTFPDIFDLDPNVKRRGCCNAFDPLG